MTPTGWGFDPAMRWIVGGEAVSGRAGDRCWLEAVDADHAHLGGNSALPELQNDAITRRLGRRCGLSCHG